MYKIILQGIGESGLSPEWKASLEDCGLLVGSSAHLALFENPTVKRKGITPLPEALAGIGKFLKHGNVGILASGDPLFYGIGRRLLAEFGREKLEIRPALSFLQSACARFRIPWDDAAVVSLHGRTGRLHFAGELLRNHKTLVFTDRRSSPDFIARRLVEYLELIEDYDTLSSLRGHVAENLGAAAERIVEGTLPELAARTFGDLNILLLSGPASERLTGLGLKEREISHSRGLITKDEVRAVTLHKLALPERGVFWDLGAGSGSMALEAALLNPGLLIYAVEKNEEELANIKANIRKFAAYNIIPVRGTAPEVLGQLADPDRVFVGGSGGRLAEIIARAAPRLPAGGRLVVNGVTRETITRAPEIMGGQEMAVEISRLEVTRKEYLKGGEAERSFNPISVMTGIRGERV